MSKKSTPISKATKKIRKVLRKNPGAAASVLVMGGIAAVVSGSAAVRARTRALTHSVLSKLGGKRTSDPSLATTG